MNARFSQPVPRGAAHVDLLTAALASLREQAPLLDSWGRSLAEVLVNDGRLLSVGNGGSAAEAQHLTSELVGRYRDDRPAFSAIALCAETSALTAIANDYGIEEMFARQVRAHGRPGDVLVAMSTSGSSPNVLAAVEAADALGMTTWAMTGRGPNPLTALSDESLCADAAHTATIQEIHLVAVHLICAAFDAELERAESALGVLSSEERL